MKEKCREFMERNLEKAGVPFDFEDIDGEMYASGEYFTFTEEPLKNVRLIQRFIIDNDGIVSLAMYEVNIENTEKFEELASLFSEKYEIRIRYDADYSTIKTDAGMAAGALIDNARMFRSFVTYPLLVLRMVVYAYYVVTEEGLDVKEVFDDITEHQGDFLIADEITYNTDEVSGIIKEGRERYFIEHDFLPSEFYDDPESFISSLKEEKEAFLKRITDDVLLENSAAPVSEHEGFRLDFIADEDGLTCIDMVIPVAENYLECSDIIFFWSDKKEPVYYTVEIKYEDDKKIWLACAWDKSGNHLDFGKAGSREEAVQIIKDRIK
ncbi:hypothetical protein [Ruminococcus sp. HUN007]|uniref:hypothetical protein n=1 Tax=Ruminococcus sp. HUN007 TaxID=1514668 RepID=UPI0005D13926|nr:hypothetical protein [Ruminococcus sp. HUN007]